MFDFLKRQSKRQAPVKSMKTLTDREYWALFEQLLAEDWDEARVLAMVAQGNGVTAWAAWVGRWDWAGVDGVRLGVLVGRLQGVDGLDGLWRRLEVVVGELVLADEGREVEVELGAGLEVEEGSEVAKFYALLNQLDQEKNTTSDHSNNDSSWPTISRKSPNLNPADEWFERGNQLYQQGKLEEAIAAYDQALEIKPDLYEAWSNRGVALVSLGRIEEAIAAYDKALEIKPDKHDAWYNRGVALVSLGRIEEAIAAYDKALEIKPDLHEAWSNRGVALGNLGRFEEAIAAYDKALEIKPDDHLAWANRATAVYSALGYGSPLATLPSSIVTLPLTKRGYEGAIETYEEGLKYCPQETHPLGWGMLTHYMGRRHYNHGKLQPNPRPYNLRALHCYTQASQTLTPQNHPTEHLKLLQDLVKVHLALRNPDQAFECQLAGLDVLKQLLNAAKSKGQKQRIEAKFHSFRQLTVDVLLQTHQRIAALTRAEMNKNRCLAMLASDPVSPDYDQIQSLLAVDTTLVAWHLSPEKLTTFIVQAGAAEPQCLVQDVQPFLDWLKDWDSQYDAYRYRKEKTAADTDSKNHPWRTGMATRLAGLAEILQIATLAQHLEETQHLILVPHRDLHRLPIHALFGDDVVSPQRDVLYLPSIQTGLNLQNAMPADLPAHPSLLSIENPQSDLLFAHIESAIINADFRDLTHLDPNTATHTQTLTELQTHHDLFHFTGHGVYNSRRPEQSALILTGQDELTAADIRTLDLSHYRLVYLAACETALTGQSSIDDEYMGLVSAFLQANARAVISTLWTVEEISSAWLAIRFYQLWLHEQLPMAQALLQAQTWLRTVTDEQLLVWLAALERKVTDKSDRRFLQNVIQDLQSSPEPAPRYAHPYYWAAFTLTGGMG